MGDDYGSAGFHNVFMSRLRVLLANEPRAYRETLAAVFRALRPAAEIYAVCSDELCETARDFRAHLVVCSRATAAVEETALAWIELYPDYGARSHVNLGGRHSTVEDIELEDILCIVDATERFARLGEAR